MPFLAYAHYSQEGRLIALHVDRSFRGPALRARSTAPTLRYFRGRHLHYSNAVIVLNVHAVMDGGGGEAPNPESSVLPVRLFGDDMQMLHDAGYHTVTPEQITAWREGVLDLPHDALLLTFDDGRTDTVLNAAPILKRVGMLATVFAIGGAWKRSPLYQASPDGLRSLQRQGWSIEAHASAPSQASTPAAAATSRTSAPAARRTGSSRRWPSSAGAQPSSTATRARPPQGIAHRPVVAFAWPFGAYGADTRTNDPRVAAINLKRGPARLQPRLQRGRPDDVQPAHAGDRPDAHRALRDRAHAHSPPAVRAARARDRRLGSGGVPCRLGAIRGQMALAACATWPRSPPRDSRGRDRPRARPRRPPRSPAPALPARRSCSR